MKDVERRFAVLMDKFLEGTLELHERDELAALLERVPGADRYLAAQLELSRELSDYFSEEDFAEEVVARFRRGARSISRRSQPRRLGWVAAAAVLLIAMAIALTFDRPSQPVVRKPTPPVAEPPKPMVAPEEPKPVPSPQKSETPLTQPEPPREEPKPVLPEPNPVKEIVPPPAPTVVAAFRVEEAEGEVFESAHGVRTANGKAVARFTNGTRLTLKEHTTLSDITAARARIEKGFVEAEVQPGAFALVSAHAEVVVLGTQFTVDVSEQSTRVDVARGQVSVNSVLLEAGMFAVAREGAPLEAWRRVERTLEDFEKTNQFVFCDWSAPSASSVTTAHGRRSFKIAYRPQKDPNYTQFWLPYKLQPGDRVLTFLIRVERFDPGAGWSVQLGEDDKDGWHVKWGKMADLKPGWNWIELEIPDQPQNSYVGGDGRYDPSRLKGIFFSVTDAASTVFVDSWTMKSEEKR
jgi:ferric-dicitrate binding protein FerR (iron transport regulator)